LNPRDAKLIFGVVTGFKEPIKTKGAGIDS
jgi:hypothetical protein